MEVPYGAAAKFKGRLFVATPTRGKPRAVSPEQWCQLVLLAAEQSEFKCLVVPWSFWSAGHATLPLPASSRPGQQYVHVVDTAAGFEELRGDTPMWGISEVIRLLSEGEDLLVVSASKKISGFIPAALVQVSAPEIHIVKVWYPVVASEGYELTPFQIGYLAGRAEPALTHSAA